MNGVTIRVVLTEYELAGKRYRVNQYGRWFKKDKSPEGWREVQAHLVPLAVRRAWGSD